MTEPIVVATDGSRGATAAVEWAADAAARKGLPLRIVHAVDRLPYDVSRYPIPSMQDFMTRSGRQILREAEQLARDRRPDILESSTPWTRLSGLSSVSSWANSLSDRRSTPRCQ